MDITPYLELKPAPAWVFEHLEERRTEARFKLPRPTGVWSEVSWGAYADQIRDTGVFLLTLGLRRGDRVAIFAPNRVEWMSAALAAQGAGGVMVPVYPSSTAEQAAYVIEHSDARVVFVDTPELFERLLERWDALSRVDSLVLFDDLIHPAAVADQLRAQGKPAPSASELERKVISWSRMRQIGADYEAAHPRSFERTLASISLEDFAVMLYTSGTSGPPKGVPLSHRNLQTNNRDWLSALATRLEERATDLFWLPMSHIFGYGECCIGNMLGWTSYMVDPKSVMERFSEVRPTAFMSVPSYWEKLAAPALQADDSSAARAALLASTGGRLSFCLSGGAGLKREIKQAFHDAGLLIIEGYGLTECAPTLTINRPESYRFDSVGKPLPTVELKLAEDGEILAKGPNIFAGYHKDPVATKDAFDAEGWFKTGDVGRFTDDGFLQIVDRKKDILVTAGGKNVPPLNIELRFKDDPFIEHLVVYGDGKKYLVAGVWLQEEAVRAHLASLGSQEGGAEPATRALIEARIQAVNAALASYEGIKRFAIIERPLTVEAGLLTPTLKVKRKKVYETFGAEFERLYT